MIPLACHQMKLAVRQLEIRISSGTHIILSGSGELIQMNRWQLLLFIPVSMFISSCTCSQADRSLCGKTGQHQIPDSSYILSDGSELYFIDAHSQVDSFTRNTDLNYSLEDIPETMENHGVRGTILSARERRDWHDILNLADSFGNIYPSVRTKSKSYISASYSDHIFREVQNEINEQLSENAEEIRFRAISEALIYHAKKVNQNNVQIAPKVVVDYGDKRTRYIKDRAKENEWPFVIHIEFRGLGRDEGNQARNYFMDGLDKMLEENPRVDFVLNHLGQLDHGDVRKLMLTHDNIYFFTAHVTPTMNSDTPWTIILDAQGEQCVFKDEWEKLIIKFPNRFIFALDNVWEGHWVTKYSGQINCWVSALQHIPPAVAHSIAHQNAEEMWDLH